jgi:hypothetical protein
MTTVLVPWRPSPQREAIWTYVQRLYAERHPDWEVRLCEASTGPWCKAAALMDAVSGCADDVVVIADADVWCNGIAEAVEAVGPRHRWAVPHLKVRRLTQEATAEVLAGADPATLPTESRPYNGMLGGGIVAVQRQALLEVPLDRRFVGWGREDCAWRDAMLTLAGKAWRGDAPLFHLWHPPQPRPRAARTESFPHNEALYACYVAARKRPDQMWALIAEAKGATTPDITDPLEDACMYRYRNENTGQIVEHAEPKARLEKLDNWTLLGEGDEPEVEAVETVSVDELRADIGEFEDDELLLIADCMLSELASRGLEGQIIDDPADAPETDQHSSSTAPSEDTGGSSPEQPAPQTVTEATDAAIELAEAEEIDLVVIGSGSGEGGRITVADIRKAVEARDGSPT